MISGPTDVDPDAGDTHSSHRQTKLVVHSVRARDVACALRRVEGVSLAYQVWGGGPATIVAIPPMAQNIELMWERPEYRTMLDRLGCFARVLHFDKRGTGASDRTTCMPTIDERVEDVQAVMDSAGLQRAHLLGVSEGGPVAQAFAATYPHRVDGVVLISSGARIHGDETPQEITAGRQWNETFAERWGTEESMTLDVFAPTLANDRGVPSLGAAIRTAVRQPGSGA
jgi:pimeloyl-ACP methyl ester carboxylesterase